MRKILMLILGMITFVPVFSQDCSFTEADFIVSGVSLDSICLKEPVTFVDSSYGDSCCWEWDFGDGADHPPGTQGEGPFSVRYNTPGEKIVRLSMVDKCGNIRENSGLIEVLPEVTLDTIIGPGILCEGTEAYFETMYSSYIDQYVWSVPDHAVILSGQSTNKIWVMLGDTSGEVTVYGEYPCGKTTTLTKNIKVNNIGDIDFLFVTGEDHQSLSVVDSLLLEKIT